MHFYKKNYWGILASLRIFIVSSVSLSLCFYVSFSLFTSVSISIKPILTLNIPAC